MLSSKVFREIQKQLKSNTPNRKVSSVYNQNWVQAQLQYSAFSVYVHHLYCESSLLITGAIQPAVSPSLVDFTAVKYGFP